MIYFLRKYLRKNQRNANQFSYPILFWQDQHKGSILIYGHLHNTDEYKVFEDCLKYTNDFFKDKTLKGYTDCPEARAYNAGTMLWDYTPVTLKQILFKDTLNMEEENEA